MSQQGAPMTFECAYDYTDIHYRPVFQKVRYRTKDLRGKTFLIRHRDRTRPSGWKYSKPPGFERYLYNLPQVWWAVEHGDDVYWCEGEKDANSLIHHGLAGVVATTHGGAGNAHPAQAAWFRGHTGRVLLVMDRDGPGAADVLVRHRLLLGAGLRAQQLLILHPRGDAKDATDHLTSGRTLHEFRPAHPADVAQHAASVTPAVMRAHGYWSGR